MITNQTPISDSSLLSALLDTTADSPASLSSLAARFNLEIPVLLRSLAALPDLDRLLTTAAHIRLAAAHINAIAALDSLVAGTDLSPKDRRLAATTLLRFSPLERTTAHSTSHTTPSAAPSSLPISEPPDVRTGALPLAHHHQSATASPPPPPLESRIAGLSPSPPVRSHRAAPTPRHGSAASLLDRAGAAANIPAKDSLLIPAAPV